MRRTRIFLSCILAGALTNLNATEVLDAISVESSTINDNNGLRKSEVSSTSYITNEEIEKINPKSISDILNKIPGVTCSLVGTDSIKVHIRGIDTQMYRGEKPGVAVVIDGVPVQETTGKINIDLDNIESIKVIKGGASYLYGNDALSGAVIITTKNAKATNKSKIETEAGSFGTKRVLFETSQGFDNSSLQLQGSIRDSDGYWEESFVKSKSINGKYQYYIDDLSDITLGLDYTKRETGDGNSVSGITEAVTNPKSVGVYSYGGYYNSDLTKAFLTYSKTFEDDSNLMLRAHKYIDDKNSKSNRKKYDNIEKWNQNGGKAEYKKSFNEIGFMAGVDIQRNTTDEKQYLAADGSLVNSYNTEENINAVYSELKYELIKDLVTTLNFRYDDIQHKYTDEKNVRNNVEPDYQTFSYRAGLNYSINDNLSLYSSFSTGFRTPSVTQISTNQTALAADPTLNIPSEIDVEKTYNYELGITNKDDLLTYNASIFQIDRKNYIGRIAGNYITSDNEEESNYDNIGDMRSRGLELAISSDSSKPVSFDLAYTYLQAKFTDYWISQQQTLDPDGPYRPLTATYDRVDFSGNNVSRTPNHTINFALNLKSFNDKLTISPELIYRGSYYADEANQFKQGGYTVFNLRTEYKLNKSVEFFGRVDNVLDKNYYQFVNVNSSALATMEDATIRVAAPRAFYAGLRYRF
ncbi:MAG: TonB-dependent receptor [Arcobacter sp.]|jgi:iron complex outermembrane receptor protein|uniref:TonB-dependent receptor n=1 Tax=Arcobacter sp. TaxID=1872629 RepID=UPI002A759AA3|nr:TonB-dependent receptor [Arcobacter sp.]MDY3204737.1 TonB-dependent receptor [Arcobacter sp.]